MPVEANAWSDDLTPQTAIRRLALRDGASTGLGDRSPSRPFWPRREAERRFAVCGVQSSTRHLPRPAIATAACSAAAAARIESTLHTRGQNRRFAPRIEGGLLHEVEIQVPAVLTIQAASTRSLRILRSIKQAAASRSKSWGWPIFSSKAARRRSRFFVACAAHVYSRERPRTAHRGSPAEQLCGSQRSYVRFKGEAT